MDWEKHHNHNTIYDILKNVFTDAGLLVLRQYLRKENISENEFLKSNEKQICQFLERSFITSSIEEWDFSAICLVLKFICKLQKEVHQDLLDLILIRNNVIHSRGTFMSNSDFEGNLGNLLKIIDTFFKYANEEESEEPKDNIIRNLQDYIAATCSNPSRHLALQELANQYIESDRDLSALSNGEKDTIRDILAKLFIHGTDGDRRPTWYTKNRKLLVEDYVEKAVSLRTLEARQKGHVKDVLFKMCTEIRQSKVLLWSIQWWRRLQVPMNVAPSTSQTAGSGTMDTATSSAEMPRVLKNTNEIGLEKANSSAPDEDQAVSPDNVISLQQRGASAMPVSPTSNIVTLNATGKDDIHKPKIVAMVHFEAERQLVASDRNNVSVKLFNTETCRLEHNQPLRHNPHGMSKGGAGEHAVLVTQPESEFLECFIVSDNSLTAKSKIKVGTNCFGVASFNDQIIASFGSPKSSVRMLDKHGHMLKEFDSQGILSEPLNVTVMPNRSLVFVSDEKKDEVIVLDGTLDNVKKKLSLKERGSTPRGMTLTEDDELLVCDFQNDRVCMFPFDTGEMSEILNSKNGVHEPLSIAYAPRQRKVFIGGDQIVVHGFNPP